MANNITIGYGCGNYYDKYGSQYSLSCLIDDNPDLWGNTKDNLQIYSPQHLKTYENEVTIVIFSALYPEIARKLTEYYGIKKFILPGDLAEHGDFGIASMPFLGRERNLDLNISDTIRVATLELCAFEINELNLNGSVAELGVYKGQFSVYLNELFPSRKLYLFDTFTGFDARDIEAYDEENKCQFRDTSEQLVLKRMKHPEQCIVRKGYFPETIKLEDKDEKFVFVSLDADLLNPIYEGLMFFYPKLEKGGYILIHNYNDFKYPGTKEAVRKFASEYKVSYVPLPDMFGSVIFTK